MIRLFSSRACALIAALTASPIAVAAPQDTQVFPTSVELVRIEVVALDRDGRPVTGLTAGDFEVAESGRIHEILSFEPVVVKSPTGPTPAAATRVSRTALPEPDETRCLLIFFDDVHVSGPSAERVRAQLVPFLEREVRAGDWVTIVSPLADLKWTARQPFEHRQLLDVVRSLRGQLVRRLDKDDPGEFEAMRNAEYAGRDWRPPPGRDDSYRPSPELLAEEVYAVARRRVRRSLGALEGAIRSLAGLRGRKSVIFYSEGFIKAPGLPDYDRLIEVARHARVAVYFVDPRGLDGESGDGPLIGLDTAAGGTSYISTATGGDVSFSNDLTSLVERAMVESTAYYLLGFQPPPGATGDRRLKVTVRREGLTVRAPDRYVVGALPDARRAPPPAVQALDLVTDAGDIPLRVAALFLDDSPDAAVPTTFAVELQPPAGLAGRREMTLLVEARPLRRGEPVRDAADFEIDLGSGDRPRVATRTMSLAPGVWQARLVVRDLRSGRLGSALHTFEVPSGAGLRLSSPLLADAVEASPVLRPRLQLDRRYSPDAALYCQFRVFGAAREARTGAPRVRASYAILRNGRPVQQGSPAPIEPTPEGEIVRLLGIGLAGFAAGDYTLALRVVDEVGGQESEAAEPFTVVAAGG